MKPRAMLFGPILLWGVAHAQQGPSGEVRGTAWQHTQQSLEAALANAWVALPAKATGGGAVYGKLAHVPKELPPGAVAAPVLVFTHGSGGISDAIKQRQKCLADGLEIASITADSMQLPDPIVYTSPVSKDAYEKVHALRAQEINADRLAVVEMAMGGRVAPDYRRHERRCREHRPLSVGRRLTKGARSGHL